jgi:hypothetical protein
LKITSKGNTTVLNVFEVNNEVYIKIEKEGLFHNKGYVNVF